MISRIGYSPKVQTLKNNINSKNNSATNPSTSIETTKAFEFPKFANVYFMGENNLSKAKSDEIILTDYPKIYINPETNNFVIEKVLKNKDTNNKKILQITEKEQDTGKLIKVTYSHPDSTKKQLECTYINMFNGRHPKVKEAIRYAEDGETPIYKESHENTLYCGALNTSITSESLDGVTNDLGAKLLLESFADYTVQKFPKTGVRVESLVFGDKESPILASTYYDAKHNKFRDTKTFPNSPIIQHDTLYYKNGEKQQIEYQDTSLENYKKSYFNKNGQKIKEELKKDNSYEVTMFQKNGLPLSIIKYTNEDQTTKISEEHYKSSNLAYSAKTEYREDGITPYFKSVSDKDLHQYVDYYEDGTASRVITETKKGTHITELSPNGATPISETYYVGDHVIVSKKEYDRYGNIIKEYSKRIDKSQYPKEYVDPETGEDVTEKIITDKNEQLEILTTYKKDGKLTKEIFSYPETAVKHIEKVYDSNGNLTKETYYNGEETRNREFFYNNGNRLQAIAYGDDGISKKRVAWKCGANKGTIWLAEDGSICRELDHALDICYY